MVADEVVRPLEATALITGIDTGVEKTKFPEEEVPPESSETTA
jgi:hypothetical protein